MEARKVALITAAGAGILLSSALAFVVKYVAALFLSTDTAGYRIASAGTPGIWLALPVSEALTFILIAVSYFLSRKMR